MIPLNVEYLGDRRVVEGDYVIASRTGVMGSEIDIGRVRNVTDKDFWCSYDSGGTRVRHEDQYLCLKRNGENGSIIPLFSEGLIKRIEECLLTLR